jgi:hypothetical protein
MLDSAKPPMTQADVRKALIYDQATGIFTWRQPTKYHPRLAGQRAGCDSTGYVLIRIGTKKMKAHRLAWLYVYGEWPSAMIDHIEGNPTNNAISNLRLATMAQNLANARRREGKALPKGVRQNGSGFTARIRFEGKLITIGTFSSSDDAASAYLQKAKALYGDFARAS